MDNLVVENVTIAYQSVMAVQDVSFKVEQGDRCYIVGNNGSGKTSLMKAILGLIPIQNGRIQYNLSKDQIAYMPQLNGIESDFPANVLEVVLTGTQKKTGKLPFYSKKDMEKAKNAMEIIGIGAFEKTRIGQLSGGQMQRVLLARALCREPELLILDEPCSGLDECIAESFYDILMDLNEHRGVGLLMVSHDLDRVKKNAKHVVHLNKRLMYYGTAEEWQSIRKGGDE